jgi:hypothetical protein
LPVEMRIRLVLAVFSSRLLYASRTWPLGGMKSQFKYVEMRCSSIITGLPIHEASRESIGIYRSALEMQYRWAGHVSRMPTDRPAEIHEKQVLECAWINDLADAADRVR